MASVTQPPRPEPAPAVAPRAEGLLVDEQIRRTRRGLKLVDLTTGLITLAIGALMYLLAVSVMEHWVVPGGWSNTARAMLFAVLVAGIAWYGWRTFWPLLRQSINPVYAAQAIEQTSPSLKNSLLNLILLRGRRRQLSPQVFRAIEEQAAQRLAGVRLETVVDRSAIVRLGRVLVAVVALCAVYLFFSPKGLLQSAGRVLRPWADLPVPSRVQILDVTPGDAAAARGEQLDVSAEVHGLDEAESVRLIYSTGDQQIVGQQIVMTSAAGGSRYECRLPGRLAMGNMGGIQQNLTYWIDAGDARSARYQVEVFARPTLVVQAIRYEYPEYTGYPTREVHDTGDIRAIEGTVVTISALANKPIKAAHVDFEADGLHDLLMNSDGKQASVSFPLELGDDRRTPKYRGYVLRYATDAGRKNKLPPKYQIEVTPDYAPEIQLLAPEEAVREVGLDEQVVFEIDARDPDFALRRVVLRGKVADEPVLREELLGQPHTGRFMSRIQRTPAELGLKVGDVLEYWGAASDNRAPKPNLSFTVHRKLRVVGPGEGGKGLPQNDNQGESGERSPDGGEQQGEGEADDQAEGMPGGEGQADASEGETGEAGEGGAGQQGEGQPDQQQPGNGASSEGQQQGNNQNTNPGEPASAGGDQQPGGNQNKVSPEGDDDAAAFERIAEHFQEQQGEQQQGETGGDPAAEPDPRGADGAPDADQSGEAADDDDAQPGRQTDSDGVEGQPQDRTDDGTGAEGQPEQQMGDQDNEPGEGEQQDESAPGGQMSREQGPAGAGENPGENEGAPSGEMDKKPNDEKGDQSSGGKQNDQEPPAPSRDTRESDSEGGQGGDRSGGGQEGAGQQADDDGAGGPGEHQAADEGAGKAGEPGEGEAGNKPGDQQTADGETGESSGNQPGPGTKPGEPASAGGDAGGKAGGKAGGDEQPTPENQQPTDNESAASTGAGNPSGAGQSTESTQPSTGEILPGDEANLDYARKQTKLILDRLDDQLKKREVDQGLLEKLGWTKDELRRFVDRWNNLKSQATGESASADGQRDLNNALRSLGLSPNRQTGFDSQLTKDKLRDLQDAYRTRTPLEYQEQVRAYVKGTATAEEE